MTKFIRKFFEITLVFLLISSSTLALISHYRASEFDPIKEIQKLKSQNRRDDALDLVKFFKENQTGDKDTLNEMEKDLEYTSIEKMKSFTKVLSKAKSMIPIQASVQFQQTFVLSVISEILGFNLGDT